MISSAHSHSDPFSPGHLVALQPEIPLAAQSLQHLPGGSNDYQFIAAFNWAFSHKANFGVEYGKVEQQGCLAPKYPVAWRIWAIDLAASQVQHCNSSLQIFSQLEELKVSCPSILASPAQQLSGQRIEAPHINQNLQSVAKSQVPTLLLNQNLAVSQALSHRHDMAQVDNGNLVGTGSSVCYTWNHVKSSSMHWGLHRFAIELSHNRPDWGAEASCSSWRLRGKSSHGPKQTSDFNIEVQFTIWSAGPNLDLTKQPRYSGGVKIIAVDGCLCMGGIPGNQSSFPFELSQQINLPDPGLSKYFIFIMLRWWEDKYAHIHSHTHISIYIIYNEHRRQVH